MRVIICAIIILMAVNLSGAELNTVAQMRYTAYKLLGVDSTGVGSLDTGTVRIYVNMAVNKVNDELELYQKTELITTTDHANFVALDSVIRLRSCMYVGSDTTIGLKVLYSNEVIDSVLTQVDEEEGKPPRYAYMWGDSIAFVPTPNKSDTIQVHYIHLIPLDSVHYIPSNYRDGVLFYTAMLCAMDMNSPKLGSLANLYEQFITRKRGRLLIEN